MRKTITANFLRELDACLEAIESFQAQEERDTIKLLRKYLQLGYFDWVNWLIVRLMNRKQTIKYAVHAAELVLPIWEEQYPDDKRPRETIQAAKKVLERDSEENRKKARAAAWEARAAAKEADYAARAAARTAAYAAAWTADTAYTAGRAVANAAVWAAAAARMAKMVGGVIVGAEAKIIEYGIGILNGITKED